MKKPRYTYYTLKGRKSFSATWIDRNTGYLMRRDSDGFWTSVYLVAGIRGSIQNVRDEDFDRNASLNDWVKASPKLARRAAQLNKK